MASTKWDDPNHDILDDMAAATRSIREGGEFGPGYMIVNLKQYAWLVLGRYLFAITLHLSEARTYKLPKSSFMDHIRDCFGWKRPPGRYDKFCRHLLEIYRREYPQIANPWTHHPMGCAVDIDIIRGGRHGR